jgi:tetratricopeptide (TPR) repeat protein
MSTPEELSTQGKKAYKRGKFVEAAELFEQAAKAFSDNPLAAAEEWNNCSVALLMGKDPQKAYDCIAGTDKVFAEHNEIVKQGMALANTSAALQALKRYEEALELAEKASDLLKGKNEEGLRSPLLKQIAELQFKTGKQFQAGASLDAALATKPNANLKDKAISQLFKRIFSKLTDQ